jgi:hypothetical protein
MRVKELTTADTAMMAPFRHSKPISLPGIATFFSAFVKKNRRYDTKTYTAVQTAKLTSG